MIHPSRPEWKKARTMSARWLTNLKSSNERKRIVTCRQRSIFRRVVCVSWVINDASFGATPTGRHSVNSENGEIAIHFKNSWDVSWWRFWFQLPVDTRLETRPISSGSTTHKVNKLGSFGSDFIGPRPRRRWKLNSCRRNRSLNHCLPRRSHSSPNIDPESYLRPS